MMTTSKKVSRSRSTIGWALLLTVIFAGCDEAGDGGQDAFVVDDGRARDGETPDGEAADPRPDVAVKARLAATLACATNDQCDSGHCADGVCCDTACDGSCLSCALTGNVGTCSPVIHTPDDTCDGDSMCDDRGRCRNALGRTCSAPADCASGNCVDGFCCASAACGTCQACGLPGSEGACAPVARFTDDPDTCSGGKTCDGLGTCRVRNGGACTVDAECTSQQCVDGVCCDTRCDGTCYSCNQPGSEGTCQPLHGADDLAATAACSGTKTCSPAGVPALCKLKDGEACATSDQCAGGLCITTYLDRDGDGFGGTSSTRRCGQTPPTGYVPRGNDCCDTDARSYPGETEYRAFRNGCDSFDWDCNGTLERRSSMSTPIQCGCLPALGSAPASCAMCK